MQITTQFIQTDATFILEESTKRYKKLSKRRPRAHFELFAGLQILLEIHIIINKIFCNIFWQKKNIKHPEVIQFLK